MLILLAHGSRDPRWRASVQKLAESVRAKLGCEPVRVAYLEGSPALPDLAADAARAGVKRLRILPLFLAADGHVLRDVHPLVDRLRQTEPALEVELLPPVGQHPLFAELLCKIAVEPAESGSPRP
jgi:sirohydrochlorin cobaltochelatase